MNTTPSQPNTGPGDSSRRQMVPLTVWLCSDSTNPPSADRTEAQPATDSAAGGTRTLTDQTVPRRLNRTAPGQLCVWHQQVVGRQLARHLIETCTREGDLIAEGFTTSEATLVTAAELNRRAIALVPHFPLAQHIGNRLRTHLEPERLGRVQMRPCRPDQMARGLSDHLGDTTLVIAAPPPHETGGRRPQRATAQRCPACRAELWMLTIQQLGQFLNAAWAVLHPGGVLAVATTARHHGGHFTDPAPRIIRQAQSIGFRYVQHVIALRVPVDGDTPAVQAGPADLAHLRYDRSAHLPPTVTVHADVCLFTKSRTGGS